MEDRLASVCDLLMGAAYADKELHDHEKKAVADCLAKLVPGGELNPELQERIDQFDPAQFDMKAVAAVFAPDAKEDRKKLLDLVAAVHAADEVHDFDEDEYLVAVAAALELGEEDIKDHAWDYEVEVLQESLATLSATPPPIPKS